MTKTLFAILMLAATTLNGAAAIAATAPAPTDGPLTGERTFQAEGIPHIPACWIVPVSCR